MSTLTAKRLIDGTQLTDAVTLYYEAPVKTKTLIKKIVLVNNHAAAVTVNLYLPVIATAAGAPNMILKEKTIPSGRSYEVTEAENQVLEAGGSIQAIASDGGAVSIVASGVEIVG